MHTKQRMEAGDSSRSELDQVNLVEAVASSCRNLRKWFENSGGTLSRSKYHSLVNEQLDRITEKKFEEDRAKLRAEFVSTATSRSENVDSIIEALGNVNLNTDQVQGESKSLAKCELKQVERKSLNSRSTPKEPLDKKTRKSDKTEKHRTRNPRSSKNCSAEDNRLEPNVLIEAPHSELRPYQKALFLSVLRKLNLRSIGIHRKQSENCSKESNSVLAYLPTGGGKTVVASHLIRFFVSNMKRCIFVVNRTPLVDQTAAALQHAGLGDSFSFIKANYSSDESKLVQIASIQTLFSRIRSKGNTWMNTCSFDIIFIDEAHGVIAKQYESLLGMFPKALIVGLTATPFRLKECENLGKVFETAVSGPSVSHLISKKRLVPPVTYCIQNSREGDDEKLLESTIAEWKRVCGKEQRPTIAFCRTKAQSKNLSKLFRAKGITSAHLDGETNSWDRDQLKQQLAAADGTLAVLCSVNVLSEGFDVPAVGCVILLRPTASKGLYIQQVGRGLRPSPGTNKRDCVVLDCVGNVFRHGPIDGPLAYRWEAVMSLGQQDLNRRTRSSPLSNIGNRVQLARARSVPTKEALIGNRRRAMRAGARMVSGTSTCPMAVLLRQCKECKAWMHHQVKGCGNCAQLVNDEDSLLDGLNRLSIQRAVSTP